MTDTIVLIPSILPNHCSSTLVASTIVHDAVVDSTRRVVVGYRRRLVASACRHRLAAVAAVHDARRVVVVCHRRTVAVAYRNRLAVVAVVHNARRVLFVCHPQTVAVACRNRLAVVAVVVVVVLPAILFVLLSIRLVSHESIGLVLLHSVTRLV